ncbi:unnamed protein product [Paramecium sonneborni]|uniref:RING-CH-type domain-containing protein n=1 Tax=Paramecium sonneborni TaxID=65129 RepID=A0A8S1KTR3_9CILI|nr:unnamed protein product [Paramecium sonneborni]
MANNDNNDTSTQNSKFAQLNSSLQILNESINTQIPQFRQKVLKTIYSKDPVRRKQIACRIYINDLDSVPGYKVSKKQICRICICEEETSKFIAPCKCKGTSEFVHQECLKMWILEQYGVNKIYNDELFCEVCQHKFDFDVDFNDKFDINQFKRIKNKTKLCWLIQIFFIILFIFGSIQISLSFGIDSLATVAIIVVFGLITISLIIYLAFNCSTAHTVQMIENWNFQNFKLKPLPQRIQKKTKKTTNNFIRINQISYT